MMRVRMRVRQVALPKDSYKIRNFGHFLVALAAKLWFHIINFMQESPDAFENQLDRLPPVARCMP